MYCSIADFVKKSIWNLENTCKIERLIEKSY